MKMKKLIVVVLLVVAVGVGFLFLPVAEWLEYAGVYVERLGPAGPVAVAAAYAVLTVLLVPGSAITIGAGTLFGPWVGTAVVVAGANLGALLSFLLARTFLRKRVEVWAASSPRFASLDRAIGREGFKMVLLSRLSPVFPFTLLNYLLGLTKVKTGSYVLANLIGMLPGTFLYVYIGSTARDALAGTAATGAGTGQLVLKLVGLAATVGVVYVVTRTARRAMAEADAELAGAATVAQESN